MLYALIDPKTVDHETQRAAHMALAFARKELKLPMVNIKWFGRAEFVKSPTEIFAADKELRGQYLGKSPDSIYVRAGQFPEEIQEVVAHETFHLWQSLGGTIDVEGCEDRALGYGVDVMRRIRTMDTSEIESIYLDHLAGADWASDHLRKEMDRRLGKPTKAAPKKAPAARLEPTRGQGGYDKWTSQPARHSSDGSIRKQIFGRVER